MDKFYFPGSPVDFENLEFAAKATDDEFAARDCFIHLHDRSDIVLTLLQAQVANILVKLGQLRHLNQIDARQELINYSFSAVHCLPHGHVAVLMPCDDEVVDFTNAID